jgi:arabinose-5-phosphate isomerase
LAIALLEARGFSEEDFAFSHPGGSLGKRLLLKVKDIMHSGNLIPKVKTGTPLSQALLEMSKKGLGMTAIVDDQDILKGLFTDGDLRRALDITIDIHNTVIDDVMNKHCTTIEDKILAAEALAIMEGKKINGLIVTDTSNKVIGAMNMHDLLRAGVL